MAENYSSCSLGQGKHTNVFCLFVSLLLLLFLTVLFSYLSNRTIIKKKIGNTHVVPDKIGGHQKENSETRMTASFLKSLFKCSFVDSQRGLARKFADCVFVLINRVLLILLCVWASKGLKTNCIPIYFFGDCTTH